MNDKEVGGRWDVPAEAVPAKWGKLTRADRRRLSGIRQSHQTKLYEHYGITQEDADRARAAVEEDSHDLLPRLGARAARPDVATGLSGSGARRPAIAGGRTDRAEERLP